MNIEKIIYETTREIYSVEDKLSIATIFLFCNKLDTKLFSELLYTDNIEDFIEKLNSEYYSYDVDFSIKLKDKNVLNAFRLTREKVISVEDKDGFYKAVFEKDPFALVICDIVNFNFDKVGFIKNIESIQLKFNF